MNLPISVDKLRIIGDKSTPLKYNRTDPHGPGGETKGGHTFIEEP
jgi:hypothetical protein